MTQSIGPEPEIILPSKRKKVVDECWAGAPTIIIQPFSPVIEHVPELTGVQKILSAARTTMVGVGFVAAAIVAVAAVKVGWETATNTGPMARAREFTSLGHGQYICPPARDSLTAGLRVAVRHMAEWRGDAPATPEQIAFCGGKRHHKLNS